MHIVERHIALDEFREERFEPFAAPPFGAVLHKSVLMEGQGGNYAVLDLIGALAGSESKELIAITDRLILNGERAIVINLKSATKVDDSGIGALVSCYVKIIESGGALLLANPSKSFCRLIAARKFL